MDFKYNRSKILYLIEIEILRIDKDLFLLQEIYPNNQDKILPLHRLKSL